MKDQKYYLIAKSIYDKYIETPEFINVHDLVNKPVELSDKQIIQDHIDTISSLYYDETGIGEIEWELVIYEIRELLEKEL